MLELDCKQGSAVWKQARMGIVTASNFGRIVTPGLKASRGESVRKYRNELVAQYFLGECSSQFLGSWATERGFQLEPRARAFYQYERNCDVRQTGMVYRDETRLISCSPDGIVDADRRGLEIKCPEAPKHLENLACEGLPQDYRMQVQGSMWVTGLESWDFLSWHPDLPPKLHTELPDAEVFEAFDRLIPEFVMDLLHRRDQLASEHGLEPMSADVDAVLERAGL